MAIEDDEPDEAPLGGPPLPPDDRLWRHPSEVGGVGARPGGRRMPGWVPVLTAAGGVLATLAVLGLAGVFADGDGDGAAAVERVAAPAVATVPVLTGGGVTLPPTDPGYLVTVETADAATGTGLVARSDGHVITAASLVEDDDRVVVVAEDGERGPARVVGSDGVTGVAVLEVPWLDGRPGAVMGSPRTMTIGDPVHAAVGGTAAWSPGQVSDLSATAAADGHAYHGLMRTTAALPVDGVGGPVLDDEGQVVAVALWGDPSPATWAVPIDLARRVAGDLIADGRAHHPWLGVEGEDAADGPRVHAVTGGGPADVAGLTTGDVLVTVAGRPVRTMADVILAVREHRPGDDVAIEYRREGRDADCRAVLAELPPAPAE